MNAKHSFPELCNGYNYFPIQFDGTQEKQKPDSKASESGQNLHAYMHYVL